MTAGDYLPLEAFERISAEVRLMYSNIGREWVAELVATDGDRILADARGQTRSAALRELAEAIEAADVQS